MRKYSPAAYKPARARAHRTTLQNRTRCHPRQTHPPPTSYRRRTAPCLPNSTPHTSRARCVPRLTRSVLAGRIVPPSYAHSCEPSARLEKHLALARSHPFPSPSAETQQSQPPQDSPVADRHPARFPARLVSPLLDQVEPSRRSRRSSQRGESKHCRAILKLPESP